MDLIAVGIVRAAHGVRGELAVESYSGSLTHFSRLRAASLRKKGSERLLGIESVRQRSTDVLVRFSGIDTREKAQALAGFELWVEREHAAPLAEGEFYAADLCKCSLYYGEQLIGTVRSVVDAGPNQLLEVARAEGKTLLVPFIDHFIAEVDVEGGRISLREDYIVR